MSIFSQGAPYKRVGEMWGPPTTFDSQPGRAVYSGWRPGFACNYADDKMTGFELGGVAKVESVCRLLQRSYIVDINR